MSTTRPTVPVATPPTIVVPPVEPSKTPYIIIGVLLIVLLLGWMIYLLVTWRSKTGLFKPYTPKLGAGLTQAVSNELFVPMTPTTKAKRDALVNAALQKLQARRGLANPAPTTGL